MEDPGTRFHFVKRLPISDGSIFYSFVPSIIDGASVLIGIGRNNWNDRNLRQIIVDACFNIIRNDGIKFRGEDPRVFFHNSECYIVDNYHCDMHLIHYAKKTYTKIDVPGKNPSFFSYEGKLYFIHYVKPFALYTFCVETGKITPVEVDDDGNTMNYEYRGGTPGYPSAVRPGIYYGYGHRTYTRAGQLMHDVYRWEVDMTASLPRISIIDVEQPPNSNKICDPTCIIYLNSRPYLITAESASAWNKEQDYITNLYAVVSGNPSDLLTRLA